MDLLNYNSHQPFQSQKCFEYYCYFGLPFLIVITFNAAEKAILDIEASIESCN